MAAKLSSTRGLVSSLELEAFDEPMTLSDAMYRCAALGEGGPYGDMGWRLPTMAELTSLDGEEWNDQRGDLGQFRLPVQTRSEKAFWTTTKWLGEPEFACNRRVQRKDHNRASSG